MKNLVGPLFALPPIRLLMAALGKIIGITSGVLNRAYGAYLWPDSVSKNLYIHTSARVKDPQNIVLGHNILIGPGCILGGMGGIVLGDYVRMSEGACIETGGLDINADLHYPHIAQPIVIGNGVWLGFRCVVLAGVTIGDNSVIGAHAVVTNDVPPNSIAIGIPARILPKK